MFTSSDGSRVMIRASKIIKVSEILGVVPGAENAVTDVMFEGGSSCCEIGRAHV